MTGRILHIQSRIWLFKRDGFFKHSITKIQAFLEPGDIVRVYGMELVEFRARSWNALRLIIDSEEFYILALEVGESPASRMEIN